MRRTGILAWRSSPGSEKATFTAAGQRRRCNGLSPTRHMYSGCPASIGLRLHCADVRIVSLLPSATEIVCLLGLEDQLVGVSADSDWPVEVVKRQPVLNTVSIDTSQLTSKEIDTAAGDGHRGASLYHVDSELLRQLRPDLILTQEICEVCAVSRRDVELATQTLGYTPRVLSLSPVTLAQVLEDVDLVARIAGAAEQSAELGRPITSTAGSRCARALVEPCARTCSAWSGWIRRTPPVTGYLRWSTWRAVATSSAPRRAHPGGSTGKTSWHTRLRCSS